MNQYSSSSEGLWWSEQSKYKGVVPQPNGRWGAQIYENNHRMWLGTFDSQEDAAMSYDRAASMFRGNDASLNFQHEENSETMDTKHMEEEVEEQQRERMFEKPLTPSDVGKLNRLVIPKQHAEKYFPLGGDESVEKGLLLSFEDEMGKVWRFRYSYWNSSQSYVLTKGWSRFVKEKQLDAGDVVWFERRRDDAQQLYIRWRRRVPPPQDTSPLPPPGCASGPAMAAAAATSAWTRMFYSAHPYPSPHLHGPLSYQQQPDYLHAAPVEQVIHHTTPGNTKRLRLFGVNLDCQLDESDGSYSTSQGGTQFEHDSSQV